ncbi:hypothetical protein BS50DRAFT_567613 [Corynespora cassiicola Philippines]|uniref:C2H2-type domain-containing protein n=1 Tax=Corynespora cassiicola Philippines TaxID=1448308 RepID=A0A2T2PBB7_CORCC|nr:hypothetical protein BS50DRAFT_567613 [Corynespora cassiicola Philippines]
MAHKRSLSDSVPTDMSDLQDAERPSKFALVDDDDDEAPASKHQPQHQHPQEHPSIPTHITPTQTPRCEVCKKRFPSPHTLDLHFAEYHNLIVAMQRERGEKTYACLVEGCDKVCGSPQKRRLHCIDKHGFQKQYDFTIIKNGIDGRLDLLIPDRRWNQGGKAGEQKAAAGGAGDGEPMDVARDLDQTKPVSKDEIKNAPRAPVQLSGRKAGLPEKLEKPGHGRGGGGRSYADAPGTAQKTPETSIPPAKESASPSEVTSDPMDSLSSSMSALAFIPRSVQNRALGRTKP